MSTDNEPKKNTYYAITPLKYHHVRPYIKVDEHFSVFKAEYPDYPDGMEYKVEFLTGTNHENFKKDLEEIVSTMEDEDENFQKRTFLKQVVKNPCYIK